MSTLVRYLPEKILVHCQYKGRESDYLGQEIVTPQMVAKKIRDMRDNK